MKWKIATIILAVIAVSAVALLVTNNYRFNIEKKTATTEITKEEMPSSEIETKKVEKAETEVKEEEKEVEKIEKKPSKVVTKTTKKEMSESKRGKKTTESKTSAGVLQEGTKLEVSLETPVSSKTSNVGDRVVAKTTEPVMLGEKVIIKEGTEVSGKITNVIRASKGKDSESRATISMVFTKAGNLKISASPKSVSAKSTAGRDAAIIVGSGVAGAILGKVIGKSGKATAAGGVVGAAVGMGIAATQKGYDVELASGTGMTLTLDEPVALK